VESVFGAVPNLSFEDVAPAANAGVAWEATHTADTAHIAYTVQLGSKTAEDGEETFWARIGAEGPTTADLQKLQEEAREGGDVETLRQRHAALQDAQVQAEAFNRRHGDWVYRLGSWQAKRLRKPLGELLEEVPEGPEQIAARHILISYQGAERAGEEVTRSKEEARTLAASLREKLLAGEADFAELARKHSDGPSAEKGGDLGTFGRDQMHKNFEAAAFDLEVGGISKVVETPFGFHVIERTE
jgi:parvulin-like peptidyl-prolyl isomerase